MPGISLDDVLLVNPSQIRPATADGIAQAESVLGVRMPPGYAAYMERLGEGALGHFVRVHEPAKLPALTLDWRVRIKEYWFWDTSEAGVAPESLQERGVFVADSFDGDELCFDPADPENNAGQIAGDNFAPEAIARMRAQIHNDARGWDAPENLLRAESEPADVTQIWGNFTKEELPTDLGYAVPIVILMSSAVRSPISRLCWRRI